MNWGFEIKVTFGGFHTPCFSQLPSRVVPSCWHLNLNATPSGFNDKHDIEGEKQKSIHAGILY